MDAAQPAPATPAPEAKDEKATGTTDNEGDSLEGGADSAGSNVTDATTPNGAGAPKPEPKKPGGLKQKLKKFNLYLLLFIFILVIGGLIITIAYFQSQKASTAASVKTQQLTENTLNELSTSDATVGNANEVLNVESSAVFAGQVLVRQDLQVAGNLEIGGTVALTNLAVTGTTALAQAAISKDLAVSGNTAIQGSLTVAQSLQINGTGSFSGDLTAPQITTNNLQLNGDLILTHHITAGGPTPGRSTGPALGSGGTATVGGSDTSGSITINTGSSPVAGCFITVNFATPFNATPHVLVTPVGSAAGGLSYYVNRTTTQFSVCDATPPPAGSSFGFDYLVLD
jgi:cytoskeletal protein CcmA (bactofilin family)